MKNKIVIFLAMLMAMVGLSVALPTSPATAAPVQVCETVVAPDNSIQSKSCKTVTQQMNRWGYCTVVMQAPYITFYDEQGYCGSSVKFSISESPACRYIPSQWQNWAGSVANIVGPYDAGVFDQINCDGPPNSAGLVPAGTSHPNLYSINGVNIGNKVSSFTHWYTD